MPGIAWRSRASRWRGDVDGRLVGDRLDVLAAGRRTPSRSLPGALIAMSARVHGRLGLAHRRGAGSRGRVGHRGRAVAPASASVLARRRRRAERRLPRSRLRSRPPSGPAAAQAGSCADAAPPAAVSERRTGRSGRLLAPATDAAPTVAERDPCRRRRRATATLGAAAAARRPRRGRPSPCRSGRDVDAGQALHGGARLGDGPRRVLDQLGRAVGREHRQVVDVGHRLGRRADDLRQHRQDGLDDGRLVELAVRLGAQRERLRLGLALGEDDAGLGVALELGLLGLGLGVDEDDAGVRLALRDVDRGLGLAGELDPLGVGLGLGDPGELLALGALDLGVGLGLGRADRSRR